MRLSFMMWPRCVVLFHPTISPPARVHRRICTPPRLQSLRASPSPPTKRIHFVPHVAVENTVGRKRARAHIDPIAAREPPHLEFASSQVPTTTTPCTWRPECRLEARQVGTPARAQALGSLRSRPRACPDLGDATQRSWHSSELDLPRRLDFLSELQMDDGENGLEWPRLRRVLSDEMLPPPPVT